MNDVSTTPVFLPSTGAHFFLEMSPQLICILKPDFFRLQKCRVLFFYDNWVLNPKWWARRPSVSSEPSASEGGPSIWTPAPLLREEWVRKRKEEATEYLDICFGSASTIPEESYSCPLPPLPTSASAQRENLFHYKRRNQACMGTRGVNGGGGGSGTHSPEGRGGPWPTSEENSMMG